MKVRLSFILAILMVLIMGCMRPPQEEMANARDAVFRAENDPYALLFARPVLSRARDALARMESEAEDRRFDAARIHAAEAISLAERAIAEGRLGSERASEDAAAALNGLRIEVIEAERNVNGARYSLLDLNYDELERDIMNAHLAVDRAEDSYAEGRYHETIDIARTVRADLLDINGRVAAAAITGKR